jgi:hypothetical protein
MTPARKAALQWFMDRGEVTGGEWADAAPCSFEMKRRMLVDGQLEYRWGKIREHRVILSLTDKGRRDLHEAGR